jgi:nucleotide-binding universal stress UspA family protein
VNSSEDATIVLSAKRISMIPIKTILAPTDITVLSLPAIRYALEIGLERNAEVIIYHVIESEYAGFGNDDPHNPAMALVPQEKKRLNEFVQNNFADYLNKVAKITELIECGLPYEKIVAKADHVCADLIVMSTHGRTGLEQLILGSVTAKVVARAGCPVLLIRPK